MIPRRLVRTVPTRTTTEVEAFWRRARDLHPGWDHVTWRDPIDPDRFPLTARYWRKCRNGAQRAGLIRLETLWHDGGIYIDSDVELYRPLDPLLGADLFAGWESVGSLNDAVIGATPGHPAIADCIQLAIRRLPRGALHSGPKVVNDVLRARTDVLLLPPQCFSPYHWTERHRRHEDHQAAHPWAFGAHHWHNSHGA